MRIGLLPLARPTFDVDYAGEKLAALHERLTAAGHQVVGSPVPLLDAAAATAACEALQAHSPEQVLICQLTFTDAGFVSGLAGRCKAPLRMWAPREPRSGGRLRLNAFCGLNLASHALARNGHVLAWLYADPEAGDFDERLADLLAASPAVHRPEGVMSSAEPFDESVLAGVRITQIGAPPAGFDTCLHDRDELAQRFGATVEQIPLDTLFDAARAVGASAVAGLRDQMAQQLDGLDAVNQTELDRSLRLRLALDTLRQAGGNDAFAIRCWPEMFTEYGGAVCGPVSLLGEARVPCACEADVWGALTQLALQRLTDAPVFLVDLVDVDTADDSAVVWHCGQAPLSMAAAGTARATIHSNRRMPLLCQFALKPGRVTLLRLSQAPGGPRLVVAGGEMLDRGPAFSGTSGTLRFDAPATRVLERVLDSGLEHHMALVYGDHRAVLDRLATSLSLPVLDLTAMP